MKFFLLIVFILACAGDVHAQQNYFIYLQTDNNQPFYVKMDDKVLSSSGAGYLVIPKLSAGNYQLLIGFPKDRWPQQNIGLTVDKNDEGFLLKNFGEKGWGLYNIQTMEIRMNGGGTAGTPPADADDIFTNALAGAANTSLIIDKTPRTIPAAVNEPVNDKGVNQPLKTSAIQKIEQTIGAEGMSALYIDNTVKRTDTIRIFIPTVANSSAVTTGIKNTETVKSSANKQSKAEIQNPENPKTIPKETVIAPKKDDAIDKPVVNFNSDCRSIADEDDFLKMRRKMASEDSEDNMVKAAGKFFKSKCYSARQIQNLSVLFFNDAGKYKFFEASYAHVYDSQNFGSLQSQLSDEYFVKRFRAMVRN